MAFQLEYEFTLPKGYFDGEKLHREGTMRLATAGDELKAQADPKAKTAPERVPIALLAFVVTKLGDLEAESITQAVIESLFISDFEYLKNVYNVINSSEEPHVSGQCSECGAKVKLPINFTREAG
jgi:hypothetical protein